MAVPATSVGSFDLEACRRFQSAWWTGHPEPIERLLPPEDAPQYLATLEELVHMELEFVWKFRRPPAEGGATVNLPPPVERYLARFPRLNQPALLQRLLEQEYQVRHRYGDCPSPDEYRARFPELVASLLKLETPQTGAVNGLLNPPAIPDFEILAELGKGGMGMVFKARQISLNRQVALKVIRAGTQAGPEELARFRTEAEAAAQLQHPHIVQVFEIGAWRAANERSPLPYFSLELVEGGNLAQKINGTPQPPRPAAQLVEPLARAMHFAHQRGVLHRDLKPANVLLAADGTPKISDFGLAKLMGASQAVQTQSGAVLGTPSYMAPEQAMGKGRDIGPATDVYALGAILYELLTGRPPFQAESPLFTLDQVALHDPVPPRRLQPKVPRDLETICLKCLQKTPRKRYASADDLADDLGRFLRGEPIRARAIPFWERGIKWARRRPALASLLAVSGLAMLVILGVILTTNARLQDQRDVAQDARKAAEANFRKARDAVDQMLTRVGAQSLAEVPHMEKVRRDLLEDALRFYQDFLQQRGTDPVLQLETGRAHRRVADIHRFLGQHDSSEAHFRQAIALLTTLAADLPGVPDHRQELGIAQNNLGLLLVDIGRYTDAEHAYRQALDLQKHLVNEFPTEPRFRKAMADYQNNLGNLLADSGRAREAEEAYRQSVDLYEKLVAAVPAEREWRQNLAIGLNNLGQQLASTGRPEEAERVTRQGLTLHEQLAADFPAMAEYRQQLANAYNNLGQRLEQRERAQEAVTAYRRALDLQEKLVADFPSAPNYRRDLATTCTNLGLALVAGNRLADAEPIMHQGLALLEKLVADFPRVADFRQKLAASRHNWAVLRKAKGESNEAERAFRQALEIYEKLVVDYPLIPSYQQELTTSYAALGDLLAAAGRLPEAEIAFRQAVEALEKLATRFPSVLPYQEQLAVHRAERLGVVLARLRRLPEAEKEFRSAADFWEKWMGQSPAAPYSRWKWAVSLRHLGQLFYDTNRPAEGEQAIRRAGELYQQLVDDFPKQPDYRRRLADTLGKLAERVSQRGDWIETRRLLNRAIDHQHAFLQLVPGNEAEVQFLRTQYSALAEALIRLKDHAAAAKAAAEIPPLFPAAWQGDLSAGWFLARCVSLAEQDAELPENQRRDLAKSYADRSVQSLGTAIRKGYQDIEFLRKDPDLAVLRQREDFQKMLTDLAARITKESR